MFEHSEACNTHHGNKNDHLDFYTNSKVLHFPSSSGLVATLIRDGKHGMRRLQVAGYIRLYRTKGKEGIEIEAKNHALDGEDDSLNDILDRHYTRIGGNNRDHEHSLGKEISGEELLNYLDLPIHHPRFEGKYADHPAIDLPWYYCGVI